MKYEGMHRKDIYIEDGVHFNQDGYDEFKKVFENELRDELAKY
jgi:lysophospholipase L1-like esterase